MSKPVVEVLRQPHRGDQTLAPRTGQVATRVRGPFSDWWALGPTRCFLGLWALVCLAGQDCSTCLEKWQVQGNGTPV